MFSYCIHSKRDSRSFQTESEIRCETPFQVTTRVLKTPERSLCGNPVETQTKEERTQDQEVRHETLKKKWRRDRS